jgi:hypothetical protein
MGNCLLSTLHAEKPNACLLFLNVNKEEGKQINKLKNKLNFMAFKTIIYMAVKKINSLGIKTQPAAT